MTAKPVVPSGIPALDNLVQGLRLGDNVVWQVNNLQDYIRFTRPLVDRAVADGRHVVYLRFAPHEPVIEPSPQVETIVLDPQVGFDPFSRDVHRIIEERGPGVFYVLDNISALVAEWATDELLANFFQVTCPYLYEMDTVTYFALSRGRHADSAIARIRDTTQLLLDVYHADGQMYVHPLKVWDRYSTSMFLPHAVQGEDWMPLNQSADAATVAATSRRSPLRRPSGELAPWEAVYVQAEKLEAEDQPGSEPTHEVLALREEMARLLLGSQGQLSRMASRYLRLPDLLLVRDRVIGSGRIGGKSAGMLLARAILKQAGTVQGVSFDSVMVEHDSFYIGSDVFFTFLVTNNLFRLRLQLTRDSHITRDEFSEVEARFLEGRFQEPVVEQFRNMLEYYGQAPIIVRSSSLLEDGFGNAFAGKYRSEFCVNQGDPESRLQQFMNAVKLVYASALNPDALSYRRKRGLGDSDEQMAILVQRVSGAIHGDLFFPTLAGVAFSRNLYAWSTRIDPHRGVVRLVYGLGTRAVDRVGADYPRMVALSNPQLRPEVGARIARYSQKLVDVLHLPENRLCAVPAAEALSAPDQPYLHLLVSTLENGDVMDPVTNHIQAPPSRMVITFNNLIRNTQFTAIIDAMLVTLEAAYGRPVDTEFTAFTDSRGRIRINLLQCRSLHIPGASAPAAVQRIPSDHVLFRTNRMMCGGEVQDVRWLLYIDPRRYAQLDIDRKRSLGRVVGRVNEHPDVVAGQIVMMGPGRWGSSNIDLGVNVGYADIDNACVLVELAREEAGHVPEVSYGTHFFLDLVESGIVFLAVYPDSPDSDYAEAFFTRAPNALLSLVPEAEAFTDVLQVIDIPQCSAGAHLQLIADAATQQAVAWLE